jgi:hypothetical protein
MLTLGCFRGIVPSPPRRPFFASSFVRVRTTTTTTSRSLRSPLVSTLFVRRDVHLRVFVSHIHRPSHICDDDHCQSDIDEFLPSGRLEYPRHRRGVVIPRYDGRGIVDQRRVRIASRRDSGERHRHRWQKNGGGGGNGGGIAMSTYELLALAVGRVRDRVSYVRHAGHALRMRAARAMSSSSSSSSSTSPAGCR